MPGARSEYRTLSPQAHHIPAEEGNARQGKETSNDGPIGQRAKGLPLRRTAAARGARVGRYPAPGRHLWCCTAGSEAGGDAGADLHAPDPATQWCSSPSWLPLICALSLIGAIVIGFPACQGELAAERQHGHVQRLPLEGWYGPELLGKVRREPPRQP